MMARKKKAGKGAAGRKTFREVVVEEEEEEEYEEVEVVEALDDIDDEDKEDDTHGDHEGPEDVGFTMAVRKGPSGAKRAGAPRSKHGKTRKVKRAEPRMMKAERREHRKVKAEGQERRKVKVERQERRKVKAEGQERRKVKAEGQERRKVKAEGQERRKGGPAKGKRKKGDRKGKRPSEPEEEDDEAPGGDARAVDYLSLARLQTAALTAMAPVAGLLVAAFATDRWVVPREGGLGEGAFATVLFFVLLFLVGVCMHVFGFVLNELLDVRLDRRAGHLSKKPLVSGRISTEAAASMVVWGVIGGFLLLGLIRFLYDTFSFAAVWLLAGAFLFGGLYDIFSKRLPGADLFLGVWAYLFCLTGASLITDDIPLSVHLIGALGALQVIFNNAVEGGMKDADTDRGSGVDNIAVRMGVGTRGKWLILPRRFRALAWSIKGVTIGMLVLFLLMSSPLFTHFHGAYTDAELGAYRELWYENSSFAFFFLFTGGCLGLVLTAGAFLMPEQVFRRRAMFRTFSRHEILTYALVPVMLLPLAGPMWAIILFVFPVLWYASFNAAVYGSALQPGV